MDHFLYKNGILHAEQVAIPEIAAHIGTPFYCYSSATLQRHYRIFLEPFSGVHATLCFAVKANSNLAVLKTLAREGAGADCVSEGEIRRALHASIPANKIVFSGVGKTREEMAFGLTSNIMQFNVESEPELLALNEVALSLGKKAPIAFRINPDIDAATHSKISTGKKEHKFGVEYDAARGLYQKAASLKGIEIRGVATHIGSQLTDLEPFSQAFARIDQLVRALRADGIPISRLDLGGGLGIPYREESIPSPSLYAEMVLKSVKHLECELVFEPGRLIVGNAGILVSRVLYLKRTSHKNFLIIDAAMNDLIRPSLYDAYHAIIPVQESQTQENLIPMDVVGPVCETGDTFAKDRMLPNFKEQDLVAIRSAGAYGAVMSSNYNSRPLIPEILVQENRFAVIRPRETFEQMLGRDVIPEWV